jgi:hypothetical protein
MDPAGRSLKPRCISMLGRVLVLAPCVALAASCTGAEPPPSHRGSQSAPVQTTSSGSEVPSRQPAQRLNVVLDAVGTFPREWREVFVVGYGRQPEELGTSRGGERGSPTFYGPEYGAPSSDGTWWFLDVGKLRLAHYGTDGRFLGDVDVPPALLVDGVAFQWALPHVLADGTLVAFRMTAGGGAMLRLRDGVLAEVPLPVMFTPTYDDGATVYGYGSGSQELLALDPDTGSVRSESAYRLPSGTTFSVADDFDKGLVILRTSSGTVRLRTVTTSGAPAHVGVQVRGGSDGSLSLYFLGAGSGGADLTGYLRVTPSGKVSKWEALPSPFSSADRGSPEQLTMASGQSAPSLVYVMPDGVHVYRRMG